jgi:penicillin-binding protein 2
MATFMCSIANKGTLYYPRLFKGVADLEGDVKASIPVRIHNQLDISPSIYKAVHEAMLAVVEEGTGRKAGGIPGLKLAGKTGSAQFFRTYNGTKMKDTRAWFYGFAPFESPRYAFCFFVEGGDSGGGSAAPLAHQMLERIMALERGETAPMTYLAPAAGHFRGLQVFVPKEVPQAQAPDQAAVVPDDNDTPAPAPTKPARHGWF